MSKKTMEETEGTANTATTTTATADGVAVIGSSGNMWKLYEDGALFRDTEMVARYDFGKKEVVFLSEPQAIEHSKWAKRTVGTANLEVDRVSWEGAAPIPKDAPPKPEPVQGMTHTPSVVRWEEKFDFPSFCVRVQPVTRDPKDRISLPVLRKEVYPGYRDYYTEDRYYISEKGVGPTLCLEDFKKQFPLRDIAKFFAHKEGGAVNPHDNRAYGDEVIGFELKWPAHVDTVRSFSVFSPTGQRTDGQAPDPNISYD